MKQLDKITDESVINGYTTLDGDEGYMECHSHPSVVQCFPANTLKMNEEHMKKLLNGYQKLFHKE